MKELVNWIRRKARNGYLGLYSVYDKVWNGCSLNKIKLNQKIVYVDMEMVVWVERDEEEQVKMRDVKVQWLNRRGMVVELGWFGVMGYDNEMWIQHNHEYYGSGRRPVGGALCIGGQWMNDMRDEELIEIIIWLSMGRADRVIPKGTRWIVLVRVLERREELGDDRSLVREEDFVYSYGLGSGLEVIYVPEEEAEITCLDYSDFDVKNPPWYNKTLFSAMRHLRKP